jgi:hypothetical protein
LGAKGAGPLGFTMEERARDRQRGAGQDEAQMAAWSAQRAAEDAKEAMRARARQEAVRREAERVRAKQVRFKPTRPVPCSWVVLFRVP